MLASAPFLAAGTMIVYAGAIIVTFLFVIMLAQMEGKALYDRAARAPGSATFTCFLALVVPDLLPDGAHDRARRGRGFTAGRVICPGPKRYPRHQSSATAELRAPRRPRPCVQGDIVAIATRRANREAERRRPGRVALHGPPGHRRAHRRLAVRRASLVPSQLPIPGESNGRSPESNSPIASCRFTSTTSRLLEKD